MFQAMTRHLPWKDCSAAGLYLATLTCAFFLFQQADLYHTVGSSFAMLDGHILDMYDYNRAKFFRDEYLPIMYSIFALWNIPVKLLGLVDDPANLSFGVLAWSKLLLMLCFFATAAAVGKAARTITANNGTGDLAARFFATSPIALFAVTVLGQYDIIGLAFAMWGVAFYLQRRLIAFAWCFSVAICFKYFPVVVFVPLLVLAEKNIWRLAKLTGIALSVVAGQIALWSLSPFFRETFFLHPMAKMSEVSHFSLTPFLILIYVGACLYAYCKKNLSDEAFTRRAVFLPVFACGVFFLAITWHPQWILLAMPFFALACVFVDARGLMACDVIGMLAYVWITVNYWNNNCDVFMMQRAALQDICRAIPLQNNDLMPMHLVYFFREVFYCSLFAPFLFLLWQRLRRTPVPTALPCRAFAPHYLSLAAFFLLPSLFCAFVPVDLAEKINPQALTARLSPGLSLETDRMTIGPELTPGREASQTFVAEADNLAAVGVKFTSFKRRVTAHVRFVLRDATGNALADVTANGPAMKNNTFYTFRFPPVAEAKGKRFTLTVFSPDGAPGNAMAIFSSNENLYPTGNFVLDGALRPGALLFRLYYAPQS
jgi:hypothetical protein